MTMTDAPPSCCDGGDNSSRGACFNADRTHRYLLWTRWDGALPTLTVLLLNPSTADENALDPTLTRVVGYARRWGMGGVQVVNAFSYRTPSPRVLVAAARNADVFPLNRVRDGATDQHIRHALRSASTIMVGWSSHLAHRALAPRERELHQMLEPYAVKAWSITGGGHPAHPLYLRGDTEPVRYHTPAQSRALIYESRKTHATNP